MDVKEIVINDYTMEDAIHAAVLAIDVMQKEAQKISDNPLMFYHSAVAFLAIAEMMGFDPSAAAMDVEKTKIAINVKIAEKNKKEE